ncbi:MAG: Flp pilus assembly protein CpaB [Deltaproteobacteria bacterium]|nr:Flp pilus assembly protein CpaB [Deltaproteobacteria bacterium]
MPRTLSLWTSLVTLALAWGPAGCQATRAQARLEADLAAAQKEVERLGKEREQARSDASQARFRMQAAEKEVQRAREGWTLVPVVVAERDLDEGTVLDYDMVAKMSMPEQFVTPSAVKPSQFEKVVGQKTAVPLQRGDLILWSAFRSEGAFERLSHVVRKHGRAVSIQVDGAAGVAGWIRPDDHVDVLHTGADPRTKQLATGTLLEDVIVLATGRISGATNPSQLEKNEREYATVTLLVLPEEAEILALASRSGTLSLALRNPEDASKREKRSRATLQDLSSDEKRKQRLLERRKLLQLIRPAGR